MRHFDPHVPLSVDGHPFAILPPVYIWSRVSWCLAEEWYHAIVSYLLVLWCQRNPGSVYKRQKIQLNAVIPIRYPLPCVRSTHSKQLHYYPFIGLTFDASFECAFLGGDLGFFSLNGLFCAFKIKGRIELKTAMISSQRSFLFYMKAYKETCKKVTNEVTTMTSGSPCFPH